MSHPNTAAHPVGCRTLTPARPSRGGARLAWIRGVGRARPEPDKRRRRLDSLHIHCSMTGTPDDGRGGEDVDYIAAPLVLAAGARTLGCSRYTRAAFASTDQWAAA